MQLEARENNYFAGRDIVITFGHPGQALTGSIPLFTFVCACALGQRPVFHVAEMNDGEEGE